MPTRADLRIASGQRAGAAALALLLAAACATPGPTRPAAVKVQKQETGFEIHEKVRVAGDVRGRFDRAVRLLDEGQNERGIELLLQVAEAAPQLTTAHINLGIAYRRTGDLERAEASLQRALALNPRHPVALNEMGIVYRRTGRFQEARRSYEKVLGFFPDYHFARRNLAILCDVYLADLECALENYELYSRLVPDDATAAMWVADLRNRIGK
jgi:Flp pilus assembly protein TadD